MTHTFKEEAGELLADISFDEAEITKATNKAINKLCQNITVPGFRKGKAPLETARRYVRSNDLANETIDQLLSLTDHELNNADDFKEYLNKNRLMNGFRPSVNVTKFTNTEASFHIVYVLRPAVSKLGEYKGLKAEATKKEITDEDVENEIKRLAENEAELVPAEKTAEMGDTVNIDFVGLMNGEEFEGGSAKGFDLELGSNRFVPGFEDQCVSHKEGDKFDVALTMPENYPAPLTNKPVVFKVTLNSVKVKETPEINDEFATTLSGKYVSKDLNELKEKVKKELIASAEASYQNQILNSLLNQIRSSSEFVVSNQFIDHEVSHRMESDDQRLSSQGLSLDEYLKLVKQTKEDYLAQLQAGIENELHGSLVYDALVEAEKIPLPTNEDIEARLGTKISDFVTNYSNYLKGQKLSSEQIQGQINGYLNQLFSSILTERVQARVLELNGYKKAEEEKPAEEAKAEAKPAEEEKPAAEEKKEETAEKAE